MRTSCLLEAENRRIPLGCCGWSELVDANVYLIATFVVGQVVVIDAELQVRLSSRRKLHVCPALHHLGIES